MSDALQHPHCQQAQARRGAGTLELVLVLPVLLFVATLIINFSTLSAWKVRALVASRDVAWKNRWGKGAVAPQPQAWQSPARVELQGSERLSVLDFPSIDLPIARGPLPSAKVEEDLLDPTRGAYQGHATLQRKQPMPPRLVETNYNVSHPLLDNAWTFVTMGLNSNVIRRTKVLYELDKADASFSQAYINAVKAIYFAPYQTGLRPLDRESDFPRFGYGSPDFHPRLGSFCGLDTESVRASQVEYLIDRIRGNPDRNVLGVAAVMTHAYLNLYRGVLADLQALLDMQPPLPPADRAAVAAQLASLKAELEPLIAQLEEFLPVATNP